jgi:hypothetical protein
LKSNIIKRRQKKYKGKKIRESKIKKTAKLNKKKPKKEQIKKKEKRKQNKEYKKNKDISKKEKQLKKKEELKKKEKELKKKAKEIEKQVKALQRRIDQENNRKVGQHTAGKIVNDDNVPENNKRDYENISNQTIVNKKRGRPKKAINDDNDFSNKINAKKDFKQIK